MSLSAARENGKYTILAFSTFQPRWPLATNAEKRLRDLAKKQNRDVGAVIDACQYIEAPAVTDVELNRMAETQATLLCPAQLP